MNQNYLDLNSIPGSAIMGIDVIGLGVPSTAGYWFEVDKTDVDWVDVDVRSSYSQYKDNK